MVGLVLVVWFTCRSSTGSRSFQPTKYFFFVHGMVVKPACAAPATVKQTKCLRVFPSCPTQPLVALNKQLGRRTGLFSSARIPANKVKPRSFVASYRPCTVGEGGEGTWLVFNHHEISLFEEAHRFCMGRVFFIFFFCSRRFWKFGSGDCQRHTDFCSTVRLFKFKICDRKIRY